MTAAATSVTAVTAVVNNRKTVSFFAGLTFFCASLELLIPKPVPFFRLGLANAVIMLAVDVLGFKSFLLLLLLKTFGQAVLSGTLLSYVFLFSIAGTYSAGLAMYGIKKICGSHISYVGISCMGAFFSNLAQLLIAYFFVFGRAVFIFAPLVLTLGWITAVILGYSVLQFSLHSRWYKTYCTSSFVQSTSVLDAADKDDFSRGNTGGKLLTKQLLFKICAAAVLGIGTLAGNIYIQLAVFLLSVGICALTKLKIKLLPMFLFFISMIITSLFVPHGKLLGTALGLKITDGALLTGCQRFFAFENFVLLSKWLTAKRLNLKGGFGILLSDSFAVFNRLMEMKPAVSVKHFTETLDGILMNLV